MLQRTATIFWYLMIVSHTSVYLGAPFQPLSSEQILQNIIGQITPLKASPSAEQNQNSTSQMPPSIGVKEEATTKQKCDTNNHCTIYTYDHNNRVIKQIDARGATTNYEYNQKGQLVKTIDVLGGTTLYYYDNKGNCIKKEDVLGNITRNEYDDKNRLLTTIDANGNATHYTYDERNNIIAIQDYLGNITRNEYDDKNRLLTTIDANGNATHYTYDDRDNIIAVQDANGNITRNEYDDKNRLLTIIDANSNAIHYTYDERNNIIAIQDYLGNITRNEYDDKNRILMTNYISVRKKDDIYDKYAYGFGGFDINTIAYDPKGDRLVSTGANNYSKKSYIKYIDEDKITSLNNEVVSIFLLHDGYTRDKGWFAISSDIGRWTYSYDYGTRLLRELKQTRDSVSTTYTYDTDGNRVSIDDRHYNSFGNFIDSEYNFSVKVYYQYDSVGNLISATDGSGKTTRYQYDAANNLIGVIEPNNETTIFAYDHLGRLTGSTSSSLKLWVTADNSSDGIVISYSSNREALLASTSHNTPTSGVSTIIFSYEQLRKMAEAMQQRMQMLAETLLSTIDLLVLFHVVQYFVLTSTAARLLAAFVRQERPQIYVNTITHTCQHYAGFLRCHQRICSQLSSDDSEHNDLLAQVFTQEHRRSQQRW